MQNGSFRNGCKSQGRKVFEQAFFVKLNFRKLLLDFQVFGFQNLFRSGKNGTVLNPRFHFFYLRNQLFLLGNQQLFSFLQKQNGKIQLVDSGFQLVQIDFNLLLLCFGLGFLELGIGINQTAVVNELVDIKIGSILVFVDRFKNWIWYRGHLILIASLGNQINFWEFARLQGIHFQI